MKYFIIFVLIVIALATYLLWPTRYEPEDWDSFKEQEKAPQQKIIVQEEKIEVETPAPKQKKIESKRSGFSRQEKAEYFNNIRDIIKDQWKELDDCENDFDERFGELLKMDPRDRVTYLKDPSNLEDFLDKFSNFKGTTPSSAKMIKELAMPIASNVDGDEIMETVGFVKTCRDLEKRELIILLGNFINKDKKAKLAFITFLENEASTLTYPGILYQYVYHLESFLPGLNIKKSKVPEFKRLERSYKNFVDKDMRTARSSSPFNPEIQRLSYQHALIIQKDIQNTLKAIKKDLKK